MNIQRFHARLRLLPCVVCIALGLGASKCAEIHHLGMPDQRSDWFVCPLCDRHHQGVDGIHALHRRPFVLKTGLDDLALYRLTMQLFVGDLP